MRAASQNRVCPDYVRWPVSDRALQPRPCSNRRWPHRRRGLQDRFRRRLTSLPAHPVELRPYATIRRSSAGTLRDLGCDRRGLDGRGVWCSWHVLLGSTRCTSTRTRLFLSRWAQIQRLPSASPRDHASGFISYRAVNDRCGTRGTRVAPLGMGRDWE